MEIVYNLLIFAVENCAVKNLLRVWLSTISLKRRKRRLLTEVWSAPNIVMQKKYKDKNYSAKKLAEDLGTNTRYVSAVVNVRFHMNYASFVNKYRIEEAMSILVDKRYQNLRMEEVSDMVGFANRQSFYASFFKIMNMTPRDYRLQHLQQHPSQALKKNGRKKQEVV